MNDFRPETWMDMVALSLGSITTVLIALAPLWFKVRRIDGQVTNDHSENMRDEITQGFKDIRDDIKSLREDLRVERMERIEGDRRKEVA